jgi:hypothetical protein
VNDLVDRLTRLAAEQSHVLRIEVIEGSRAGIFITKELARMIGMEQLKLCNQSDPYKSLPKAPESCGPDREFVSRFATI